MQIDSISLAQFTLLIILGAFLGNLLSILVDQGFFSRQAATQDQPKISEVILSSLKTSLYGLPWLVLWLSLFILLPLAWHSIH